MATLTRTKPTAEIIEGGYGEWVRAHGRLVAFCSIIAVWVVIWSFTEGQDTLFLAGRAVTDFHDYLTSLKIDLIASRDDNVVMQFTGWLSDRFNTVVTWLQHLIAEPDFPRPAPQIGWLGVVGIGAWITLAVAGWRMAVGVIIGLLACGYLGFWEDTMDTFIITFYAVLISLIIGLPVAVWVGNSKVGTAIATPVLDLLQTMPAFVYLAPLSLFFAL